MECIRLRMPGAIAGSNRSSPHTERLESVKSQLNLAFPATFPGLQRSLTIHTAGPISVGRMGETLTSTLKFLIVGYKTSNLVSRLFGLSDCPEGCSGGGIYIQMSHGPTAYAVDITLARRGPLNCLSSTQIPLLFEMVNCSLVLAHR